MINTDYLDLHIEKIGGLHPQVLIKLKEQALTTFVQSGFEVEKMTLPFKDDYYDNCATIFDKVCSNEWLELSESDFERAWLEFTGVLPVKDDLYEDVTWEYICDLLWDKFESLKIAAEMVISLQALGPVANLIPAVTPK